MEGSILGLIRGDIRSLDHGSCENLNIKLRSFKQARGFPDPKGPRTQTIGF